MPKFFVKDESSIYQASKVFVNDAGTVRQATQIWALETGVPKLVYLLSAQIPLLPEQSDPHINGYLNMQGPVRTSDFGLEDGDTLIISENWWLWSPTTSQPALIIDTPKAIIQNYGNITGHGGYASSPGGPAIVSEVSNSRIYNHPGAFIAGGGGGGAGSQGGGGAGQAPPGQAGAVGGSYSYGVGLGGAGPTFGCSEGGTVQTSGSCTGTVSGVIGAGGNQGASAGSGNTSGGGCTVTNGSGSSGTGCFVSGIRWGVGGPAASPNPGGQGGSILSDTQNQTVSGGGWGLPGSGGAAGGAAISGSYISLSNDGTIYGST
jgi:hypothetical protein